MITGWMQDSRTRLQATLHGIGVRVRVRGSCRHMHC